MKKKTEKKFIIDTAFAFVDILLFCSSIFSFRMVRVTNNFPNEIRYCVIQTKRNELWFSFPAICHLSFVLIGYLFVEFVIAINVYSWTRKKHTHTHSHMWSIVDLIHLDQVVPHEWFSNKSLHYYALIGRVLEIIPANTNNMIIWMRLNEELKPHIELLSLLCVWKNGKALVAMLILLTWSNDVNVNIGTNYYEQMTDSSFKASSLW